MMEVINFEVEGAPITSGNSSASKKWKKKIEEAYDLKYHSKRMDPGGKIKDSMKK